MKRETPRALTLLSSHEDCVVDVDPMFRWTSTFRFPRQPLGLSVGGFPDKPKKRRKSPVSSTSSIIDVVPYLHILTMRPLSNI
jgi:hypothetical protein